MGWTVPRFWYGPRFNRGPMFCRQHISQLSMGIINKNKKKKSLMRLGCKIQRSIIKVFFSYWNWRSKIIFRVDVWPKLLTKGRPTLLRTKILMCIENGQTLFSLWNFAIGFTGPSSVLKSTTAESAHWVSNRIQYAAIEEQRDLNFGFSNRPAYQEKSP